MESILKRLAGPRQRSIDSSSFSLEEHHQENLYNYRQYSEILLCYMMANPSDGIPFLLENLRQGHRYIKIGKTLFPCPPSADISDLPLDQEIITVLSKQMGRIILEHDFSYVTKSGHGVRPAEAEAMRLVSKHTSVPVPEVFSRISVLTMEILR